LGNPLASVILTASLIAVVIDCPGRFFVNPFQKKKKNHENENERDDRRRMRELSEEGKRQILFYCPINNVVYTFVVWPFNE
jgi:hypothetical protein